MTKKEMFTEIRNAVADNAEMVAFIDHEIELLSKKRTSVNSKAKKETEQRVEKAFNALLEMDKAVQVSELIKLTSDEEVASWNGQRVTALLKKLVADGRVVREEIKGKAFYSVA